jgi:hypothetical protein
VADNTSGNSEELKLRITPELDDAALKKVQDQLDAIKTTTAVGGTEKDTGASRQTNAIKEQTAALKEKIAAQKLDIDQIDLRLRKTRTAANQEIASIRERAAVGKITMEQMDQQILQQQSIIDTATMQADVAYKTVATSLENLGQEYRDTAGAAQILTTAEKKLYYAQGRMIHGMDSMSGSMQTIVSQTKMANLAFMNFGRIVQDAPFGLIGIANNIDPLLMSFAMLSNEMDETTKKTRGTMGAFKAMGAQLFGPAGLIFLLGSVLPSALLLLQNRQQKTTEESNALAEAFKRVADEFGRLSSQAASEKGIEILRNELSITKTALDEAVKGLDETNKQIALQESILSKLSFINAYSKQIKDIRQQNDELKNNAEQQKEVVRILEENLKAKETELTTSELIQEVRSRYNLSESLSLKEQIELQKELNGLRANVFEILGQDFEAQVLKETQRIKDAIADVYKIEGISIKEKIQLVFRLEDELARVEERVRERQKDTNKKIKVEDDRLYKSREEFLLAFSEFVQTSLTNRVDNEKASLKEILDSEYATAEERVRAIAVSNRNILLLLKDFENQATKADDEFAQNRLKKLKESQPLPGPTEFDTFLQNREAMLNIELEYAQLTGNKILEINKQKEIDLRNLFIQYQKLNLLDTEQYANAKKAIELNAEEKTRQAKMDSQTEIFQAIGELASASIGMIFGESKNAQVAQVVIDTIMGIQKIWSQAGLNPVVGALGSAALAAKGLAAINKIKSTTTKSSSISAGSGGATTREVMAEGIGPRAGQIINPYGTIMSANAQPTNTSMMPDISIDARVDRRGLAIAVREGEQEIRTQQFSYT